MSNVRPETAAWFKGRLPKDWFKGPVDITADREEVVVIGEIAVPDLEKGATEEAVASAREGAVRRFREETRDARIKIADEVEAKWDRKLSWGVRVSGEVEMFTHLSVPVMTRLRLEERLTLDTLVDAGVARTRSDALSWCVKLVAKNEEKWLGDLRDAFKQVEKVRSAGPGS
jgi:hypothetical protein